MCPQHLLVSLSHVHTYYVSSGSAVFSVIPFECQLGWWWTSLSEWVGVFAISLHTLYVPVILLGVYFCESTSSLLLLNLRILHFLHLKPPFLQLIFLNSLLHTHGVQWMLPPRLIPLNCHSSFLSLSPPLNCKSRLCLIICCVLNAWYSVKVVVWINEYTSECRASGFSIGQWHLWAGS